MRSPVSSSIRMFGTSTTFFNGGALGLFTRPKVHMPKKPGSRGPPSCRPPPSCQNAEHIQTAAYSCKDVLQNTQLYLCNTITKQNTNNVYTTNTSRVPHPSIGGQMLYGHLTGFGSSQSYFGLSAGL
ncbi:hypothetical protein F7725_015772 [Dissostichus mawsoni]|uniref:Uncharacterized protein n=1 Tax=Dissostichus mawsoni TaxID=36200 RepID=A0A7J5YIJ4_DISMA|nr:hypothetical protein F7725_015772 [Dissostichus mawsoni]